MRTILFLLTPVATAAVAALPATAPAEPAPADGPRPAVHAAGRAHRPARLAPRRHHHQRRRHRIVHRHWLRGEASSYGIGDGLLGGSLACGGRLDTRRAVVAHRTLRCHTRLLVCRGRRCIRAIVADRGPYVGGRVLDLGPRVARAIGMDRLGVGDVRYALLR
jgi:rare lipoprotein A (peptidoglycan hydrolase)